MNEWDASRGITVISHGNPWANLQSATPSTRVVHQPDKCQTDAATATHSNKNAKLDKPAEKRPKLVQEHAKHPRHPA